MNIAMIQWSIGTSVKFNTRILLSSESEAFSDTVTRLGTSTRETPQASDVRGWMGHGSLGRESGVRKLCIYR